MRFHALAVPHTITNKGEFIACAFTQKVLKFCDMMTKRGHTVYHYGHEDSELVCSEHVTVVSREKYNTIYGSDYYRTQCFKYDQNDAVYQEYNANAIEEIKKRRQPGDFLLAFWGFGNKPVCDAFPDMIVVEPGIGYPDAFAGYRIYESYALLHANLGVDNVRTALNLPWYHTVIPNYFDPSDFEFSDQKKDYFLCLGRITRAKGVDFAIQVTEKIGARLIIAGQGSFTDIGLEKWPDHVEYVGYALADKRKELMKNAKGVFVLSTYVEPFGGTMIESFFCGTPVISTDVGTFTENNIHGVTGYRCRTFGQMLWAAQNIHRIQPKACYDWAQNYTTDRVARMYEEYFQSVYEGWYGQLTLEPTMPQRVFPKRYPRIAVWLDTDWALGRYAKALQKYVGADVYNWADINTNRELWNNGKWKEYDSIISSTQLLLVKSHFGVEMSEEMTKRMVVFSFFPVFETMTHFKETLQNFPTNSRYCGQSKQVCSVMRERGVSNVQCVPTLVDVDEWPIRHSVNGPIKRIGIINGCPLVPEYVDNKGISIFEEICTRGGYQPVHILNRSGYIYHDIDMLICCSKLEGGPNGIFEAASSGLPVLSRAVGCAQDVDGMALFDTADDAIKQIEYWNTHVDELKEYTKKVTEQVRTHWGLKVCIEKYLKPILTIEHE